MRKLHYWLMGVVTVLLLGAAVIPGHRIKDYWYVGSALDDSDQLIFDRTNNVPNTNVVASFGDLRTALGSGFVRVQNGTANNLTATNGTVYGSLSLGGDDNVAGGFLVVSNGGSVQIQQSVISLSGDATDPAKPAYLSTGNSNSYFVMAHGSSVYSVDGPPQQWLFNHPARGTNNVARLGEVTNIVAYGVEMGITNIATNSTIVVDVKTFPDQIVTNANTGYNLTIRFTNIVAGRAINLSILGPSGSNAVDYIWPPEVIAKWPVDPYTDVPTTNTYFRTNTYLDLSLLCYATNNVRIAGSRFK